MFGLQWWLRQDVGLMILALVPASLVCMLVMDVIKLFLRRIIRRK